MILPKNNNQKEHTTNIELGTAYELNKNLVKKYEKEISQEDFTNKWDTFQEYLDNNRDKYYMLLCNEEKDYTLFVLNYDDECINTEKKAFQDLKECLYNRGKVYGFDITKDRMAIEVWLEKEDKMFCYYFFKYGEAVIEC